MTSGRYVARIVELRGHGIRLEPTEVSERPDQPNEVNMLGLAIALARAPRGITTIPNHATRSCRRSTPCLPARS